jgi:superfamily II DNA or RNA helicase
MFSDFKSYGYDSDQYCHRQYAGKDKSTDKFLTITTWQSIYNLPKEYFEQFDFVLGDEAHDFKAKSLSTIMSNLENTEYRIGCTGTLDGTQTHKLVLEGLFGPVLKVITTKELMDNDQVSSLKIKCLILKYSDEVCKLSRGWDYQAEIDYLVKCPQRNAFIKNLALSLKGNSLILFQLVEKHGKELMRLIDAEKKDRKVFFVHGGTDVETREQIRHLTDSHPLEGELLFEFGDTKIKCSENELIPLTDGTTKKAKYITETDDIDARCILNNKK